MTGVTIGLEVSAAAKALGLIYHMQASFHSWASSIQFIISGRKLFSNDTSWVMNQ